MGSTAIFPIQRLITVPKVPGSNPELCHGPLSKSYSVIQIDCLVVVTVRFTRVAYAVGKPFVTPWVSAFRCLMLHYGGRGKWEECLSDVLAQS